MLSYTDIDPAKKGFIFELDHVLFPEKDYGLQVFYLFAHFIEYVETTPPAQELIAFCKNHYDQYGHEGLFEQVIHAFGVNPKYEENFNRLRRTAKLPLKLLLYKDVLELMRAMVANGRSVAVLTQGDMRQQINKIKQIEWNGLDQAVRIFFYDELKHHTDEPIHYLAQEYGLDMKELLFFGATDVHQQLAQGAQVDYMDIGMFVRI